MFGSNYVGVKKNCLFACLTISQLQVGAEVEGGQHQYRASNPVNKLRSAIKSRVAVAQDQDKETI